MTFISIHLSPALHPNPTPTPNPNPNPNQQRWSSAHKQASGALVLATAHQAKRHAYVGRTRRVPRRVRGSASSAVHGFGLFIYHFKAGRWDFYRFSRSLPLVVLLPFYVKSAELLHYPHPMIPPNTLPNRPAQLTVLPAVCHIRYRDSEKKARNELFTLLPFTKAGALPGPRHTCACATHDHAYSAHRSWITLKLVRYTPTTLGRRARASGLPSK